MNINTPSSVGMMGSRRQRGIGLIEVMVAVLVLAVGLLGVAAMQSVALRGGQSSLESSQAVMQSNAIIEAMRVNGGLTVPRTCAAGAGIAGTWISDLHKTVGAGTCGTIAGCPNDCVVTVEWNDSRGGGGTARTIVTRARL